MSEAKYWEEYDKAKKAALKMAAKLSAKEKGTMVRALHYDMIDEVDHDRTRQRIFEQEMISIDHPDENGDLYDYGDCNRAARRMFRELDAEYREKVIEPYRKYQRELRFKAALYKLRNHPELQTTLRAIRLHKKKEKIFSALKIGGETYKQRFFQLTKILKIST
jgi:hypothetical protein